MEREVASLSEQGWMATRWNALVAEVEAAGQYVQLLGQTWTGVFPQAVAA